MKLLIEGHKSAYYCTFKVVCWNVENEDKGEVLCDSEGKR